MQLSPKAINEFRQIYRQEYGRILSTAQAEEQGRNLLTLCKTILNIQDHTTPPKKPKSNPDTN